MKYNKLMLMLFIWSGFITMSTAATVNMTPIITYLLSDTSSEAENNTTIESNTTEPPGVNCTYGGIRIDSGIDADGSGTLEEDEITSTTYVCDANDTTAPIITLLGNNPDTYEASYTAYTDEGATATDDVDGNVSVVRSGSMSSYTVGTYLFTYTATDSSGNTATATRTVNVLDTTAPTITITGDNPTYIEWGSVYSDEGAIARSPNEEGSNPVSITSNTVDTSIIGAYEVVYSSTDDYNNTATATRTVYVVDSTPPVVTLIGDNPQVIIQGSSYVELGAYAVDNHDGNISSVYIYIDASDVDTSTEGDYNVSYIAYDNSQNASAFVYRTVSVTTIANDCIEVVPSFLYNIVETDQTLCYDASTGASISCTGTGQDGEYLGNDINYTSCAEGKVVVDNVTGLMWQSTTDTDGVDGLGDGDKMTQSNAQSYCETLDYGGYTDWRLPSTKELYSIYMFSGEDISGVTGASSNGTDVNVTGYKPFINTGYFDIGYGDTSKQERKIDGQYATSTLNVSKVISGISEGEEDAFFGVNFVDGHVKSYEMTLNGEVEPNFNYYVRCVRGNASYGKNDFAFTDNGTILDKATNLTWERNDHNASNFEDAVSICENLDHGGSTEWRLPNIKELQSLVDYTRTPEANNSASIDTTYFNSTAFINEAGQTDWGYYWSSSALLNHQGSGNKGGYITFGRGMGYINAPVDVHGAGAQRSDFKTVAGRDADNVTEFTVENNATFGTTAYRKGPQGDLIRVEHNFVRCVSGNADLVVTNTEVEDITDKILTNGSANCADYVAQYAATAIDVENSTEFTASLLIEVGNEVCTFNSNGIPNHDFNDGAGFAHDASEQDHVLMVTTTPTFAASPTDLTLGEANAVLLNGVKVSLLPAGCYGVSDGVKDCTDNNQPYRAVPASGLNPKFKVDSHNAHTNSSGTYHYHASPEALFDTSGSVVSPVIGFAADGFPIYGSYYDDNGTVRKVESSYQIKSGIREDYTYDGVDYNISEEGAYEGQYRDDYEYNATKSPLDECNGMTVNGEYGYYVTDDYPYIINCYSGTKNSSFKQ